MDTLGSVLESQGKHCEAVAIGAEDLLLPRLIEQPTRDLEIVSRVDGKGWMQGEPLPDGRAKAIGEVARALDVDDRWLTARPMHWLGFGPPPGLADRVLVERLHGLTVRLVQHAKRVALKLCRAWGGGCSRRRAAEPSGGVGMALRERVSGGPRTPPKK